MDSLVEDARNIAEAERQGKNASEVSRYRTRWLMAHNHLHKILHSAGPLTEEEKARQFEDYLRELQSADDVASRPA